MKFDEWLNEQEGFGLRVERLNVDLESCYKAKTQEEYYFACLRIVDWLKAAYDVGCDEALSKLKDDLK